MTLPVLDSHRGCHCAPRRPSRLAALFRRLVAAVRRKPAVPAALSPAGAAVALPADFLVRPAGGAVYVGADGHVGLLDATLARCAVPGSPPWDTAAMPALSVLPVRGELDGDDRALARLHGAFVRGRLEDSGQPGPDVLERVRDALVYGEAPVADVLEAERLAGEMIA